MSARATLIGFSAILMWSLLSLLTVLSGTVPPFQLAAMTFAIAGALGAATWLFRPGAARALKQPPEVWALGVGGLFGYHALFFMALRLAPAAEAQLVSYLWPLLIVLGFGLALTYTAPTGEPEEWSDTGFLDWMLLVLFLDWTLLFLFVAGCALVGAVLGSLQALVLRRAAEGMRRWIVISALATAVMGLVMIPTLLFSPSDGTFAREAADQGVLFVVTVVVAFVMLPAVHGLRPRTA